LDFWLIRDSSLHEKGGPKAASRKPSGRTIRRRSGLEDEIVDGPDDDSLVKDPIQALKTLDSLKPLANEGWH
jgi:hypothetical protein